MLALAIRQYSAEVFDVLLKDTTGIRVNAPVVTGSKWTFLHFAVRSDGNSSAVPKLLERGSNASSMDDFGNTPFQVACEYGHLDCIDEFVRWNPACHLAVVRTAEARTRGSSRKRQRNNWE